MTWCLTAKTPLVYKVALRHMAPLNHNELGCTQGISEGFDSCNRSSNLTQIGFKSSIFQPAWPWVWLMTSKHNRAHLLHNVKLCASFQIHQWFQTGITIRKRRIRVKIGDYLSRVTLQFDIWPWKTTGHLFYTTSSFVHGWIQTEIIVWKPSMIMCPVWPWNLMDDLEQQ